MKLQILTLLTFIGILSPLARGARDCAHLTNPNLKSSELSKFEIAISSFERMGGKGVWFESTSEYVNDNQPARYYLIKSWPKKIDPQSPIWLLRLEHSSLLLRQILEDGAPVVLANMNDSARAGSASLDASHPLSEVAAKIYSKKQKAKSTLLLKIDTDKGTLTHENQHRLDFDNREFYEKFLSTMRPILQQKILNESQIEEIFMFIIELRGHSAQEIQVKRDQGQNLGYLDRNGKIITDQSNALYEAIDSINSFKSNYLIRFKNYLRVVKRADQKVFEVLVSDLAKFDFSSDPMATLSIQDIAKRVSLD